MPSSPYTRRPDERISVSIERWGNRIKVQAFLYQGGELLAYNGGRTYSMIDEQGAERSIQELLGEIERTIALDVRMWARQLELF